MKFPKLRCIIALSLFFHYFYSFAQVISVPRLTSTHGNSSTITLCESETVTFTARGDNGPRTEYEFYIDRGGTILFPLGEGAQPIFSFSTNTLADGDVVYARVWTLDNGGGTALTNSITIELDSFLGAIDFFSNAPNNTICDNEWVVFTANSVSTSTLFEFYIDGILQQGPSLQNTFTHQISSSTTVTLLAFDSTCERSIDLFIQENLLEPGSIAGGGQFCHSDVPPTIISVSEGSYNGNILGALTPKQ